MEVILKQDIKKLGEKDDVVTVKPGYGRNYLIPQGYAILATESAKKVLAENIRQAQFKQDKIKKAALELASKLEGVKLTIGAKAGESGKIFGSVNSIQIADTTKKQGFEVDRRPITFESDTKVVRHYPPTLTLHNRVNEHVPLQ